MKKIFILSKKAVFLSAIIFIILIGLSASYSEPIFDPKYYLRIFSFPFSEPIKNYKWYTPKVKVNGNNQDLEYAKPENYQISKNALNKIVKYAEENNSLGIMIVHHGKIVTENYFREWSSQLAGESESMAKSVLSLLIGIAIDEGKINSVHDYVAKYLPEWQNDPRKKIKIKNLLEMSSGLRNSNNPISPFSDLVKIHLGFNAKDLALNVPLERSPGEKFEYNNVNSQILGILLERATGMKYSEYLSEKLWKPLGASDAEISVDETGTARTYCCLFAKMRDWAKLGLLILHNGEFNSKKIISAEWLAKMTRPSRKAKHYGYHIWLGKSKSFKKWRFSEDFVDESIIFLDGRSKQRVFILPKWDLVIVRVGETSDKWKENILPNILVRDLNQSSKSR